MMEIVKVFFHKNKYSMKKDKMDMQICHNS